ncbi:MAG: hypothetical protein HYX61_06770 [Gammaproteobacteria bacterium]|nr:hypothetical protein [Gammaproteobacteria bacterium]
MKRINLEEVLEQFSILDVPITADIQALRRARNQILHQLYEKSNYITQQQESLALDTEITTIQHAYLFIKRNYHDIHANLDAIKRFQIK